VRVKGKVRVEVGVKVDLHTGYHDQAVLLSSSQSI